MKTIENITAPRINRASMTPKPWFGPLRGLLLALWPGLRAVLPPAPTPWHAAAQRRRTVLLALVAALAGVALAVQWQARPADAGALWGLYTALLVLLWAWVGSGFATAVMGAWVLWRGDPHALPGPDALPRTPIDRGARTAVIMPVCNEDIATVFGGLRATCESVAATGALALFDFYILSDTRDPALRAAELRAWDALRRMMGDDPVLAGGRVFYRWRRRRAKRKAGNVADFCRRWGRNYRYMVVLDADSTMHGDTLVQLVRLMEANPRAGIVQTLPQPCGHGTLHARAQQFAHRVTGRLFSLGMAFWQLGDSHYWGHNAILRVEPFMRHCALARLPGRGGLAGDILSHDFVEAALISRAGYEVWLAPELGGSWEQNPPHLVDELQRDRRWCQGNLQNLRLVAEPGWRPAHRAMFGLAAFSYLAAPLWALFIALGLVLGLATSSTAGSAALWMLTLALLVAPRLLAAGAVLARREQSAYGGTWRLLGSTLVELAWSALQAPLRMLAHTLFVISALTGLGLEWRSPARQATALAWADAWRGVRWLLLPALVLLLPWLLHGLPGGAEAPWMMVVALALAVPLTVASASPHIGRHLDRLGLLANPEARQPPRALARAADSQAFARLAPAPAPLALGAAAPASSPWSFGAASWAMGRPRAVLATAAVMFGLLSVLPRVGTAPEVPAWLRAQQDLLSMLTNTERSNEPKVTAGSDASMNVMVAVRERPARRIDDAVRRRAREAVQRALALEAEGAASDMIYEEI